LNDLTTTAKDPDRRPAAEATRKDPSRRVPDPAMLSGLEQLIVELSKQFIDLPAAEVDAAIENAQRRVCECLDVDASLLWQWKLGAPGVFELTHVHHPAGTALPSRVMDMRTQFPWLAQRILARIPTVIPSVDELPPEAARERESYREFGVRSTAVLPLSAWGSPLMGALSYPSKREEREWPEPLLSQLQVFARTVSDALARKAVTTALGASEARLAAAVEIAELGFYEAVQGGRVTFMDLRTHAILGIAPGGEATGRDFWVEHLHPEDRARVLEQGRLTFSGRQHRTSLQYRYLHPTRGLMWLDHRYYVMSRDTAGNMARMIGVFREITAQKRSETSLRELAERYATLTSTTTDGFWEVDGFGRIIDVNQVACRMYGYTREDLLTLTITDLEASQLPAEIERNIEQLRARGHLRFETRHRRRDGLLLDVEVNTTHCPGTDTFLVFLRDVTAHRRDDEELRRLRRDMWHAHRVAQTGAITASLAHELNQPLTAILSNAQAGARLMALPDPDLDEIRAILADIVHDDKRAAGVIVGLRAMMRRQETQYERIDLARTIREVVVLARTEALAHDVQIELEVPPECPLSADRVQIQQVVLNLVMNAIEAMENQPAERRRMRITLITTGEDAQVAVRDWGPGIADDQRGKVFDSFWTTKSQGMGIGLPISRSIIESHGGRLWWENHAERGATFYFTLSISIQRDLA
jgi:PAS domain S-box-containing protein